MLLIPCPWCGPRNESEFVYGGDASVEPPADPMACTDSAWSAYLYTRANPKGPHNEWWYHGTGCGRWIRVVRDTANNRIAESKP